MEKQTLPPLRPASIPVVVHDPYFSLWCPADNLNEWLCHWTGAPAGFAGILRVDGEARTFLGRPQFAPVMDQKRPQVLPTRTIVECECSAVRMTLTFLTPALPHRLEILSRPVTYVLFDFESLDGRGHALELYFDCGGEFCVNRAGDEITWSRFRHEGFELMSLASAQQNPLHTAGDDLRIDWGRAYLGVPKEFAPETAISPNQVMRRGFAESGTMPASDSLDMPRRANNGYTSLGVKMAFDLPATGVIGRWLFLGYDDVWSIEYLGRKLPAYWRRSTPTFAALLDKVKEEFEEIHRECIEYDRMLFADAGRVGGEKYARLCALAFRQAIGAHKLTIDLDGTPLFFSKENFSNGCIATVDVTYPSAPLFLLTQPELLKAMMTPILQYAESYRWKFPFAPHDLGTYPLANGQVYGGGEYTEENQMPVEECGNMLLLAGALLRFAGEKEFIAAHAATWKLWAEYLLARGYDPENQLCTDDFAGHLAHNANLSLKAILALGAYSQIAGALGDAAEAERFLAAARNAAERWCIDALDGDHYRLAFDRPGTWSQKYNLVWDRLLGLGLFPAEVAKRELAFYRTKQNRYGLPLDSRRSYTKIDWILWSATLTGDDDDFAALLDPVYRWLDETPDRVPLTDWYETTDGRKVGFQARSVVGGLFLKMLYDEELCRKYLEMARR